MPFAGNKKSFMTAQIAMLVQFRPEILLNIVSNNLARMQQSETVIGK